MKGTHEQGGYILKRKVSKRLLEFATAGSLVTKEAVSSGQQSATMLAGTLLVVVARHLVSLHITWSGERLVTDIARKGWAILVVTQHMGIQALATCKGLVAQVAMDPYWLRWRKVQVFRHHLPVLGRRGRLSGSLLPALGLLPIRPWSLVVG